MILNRSTGERSGSVDFQGTGAAKGSGNDFRIGLSQNDWSWIGMAVFYLSFLSIVLFFKTIKGDFVFQSRFPFKLDGPIDIFPRIISSSPSLS